MKTVKKRGRIANFQPEQKTQQTNRKNANNHWPNRLEEK